MSCQDILKHTSILLVEDEQNLANLLKEAIGGQFEHFAMACDGTDGLRQAYKLQPDIVVTDITMPHMNGLEMSSLLREKNPDLPIVILSAYSDKDYLLDAIDAGVTKYLVKPFDPDELLEVLCTLMQKINKRKVIKLLPPFSYDTKSKKLFINSTMVRLSKRENRFLSIMLENPNYFMSPEDIKKSLWDETNISDERLRVFINRLRSKTDHDLIGNIVGQGYIINTQPPSVSSS